VKAALVLAEDTRFDVTLVSDKPSFGYYPSMYHTATGGSSDVSSLPLNEIFQDKKIKIIQKSAVNLDRQRKVVLLKGKQEIAYDKIILAMGVVTNFFHIPGLDEHAYGIKSLEDAERFKCHLHKQLVVKKRPDQNYVIVGGGPTGIELAGVLGQYMHRVCEKHGLGTRSINVDLVEAAPRLVPRMPKDVSRAILRQLRRRGVKVHLNMVVKAQTAEELVVNGKPIHSQTVVWTAGVANHPFFAEQGFQLAKNGKVRVDQYLQAEPGIFVIGDNADTPYSGMAQTALRDGIYVGSALIEVEDGKSPSPYRAKKPIYVMPAGPNWAAVLWGPVRIYGRIGWWLRRAADFMGYRDYESWFRATKHWFAEYDHQELCPHCEDSPVKK